MKEYTLNDLYILVHKKDVIDTDLLIDELHFLIRLQEFQELDYVIYNIKFTDSNEYTLTNILIPIDKINLRLCHAVVGYRYIFDEYFDLCTEGGYIDLYKQYMFSMSNIKSIPKELLK